MYKDMFEISLKYLEIDPLNWEKLTLEQPAWRRSVKRGATRYEEECILYVQTKHREREVHKTY